MGYCASMYKSSFHVKTEYTGRVIKKLENYGYTAELDDDGNIIRLDFNRDKIAYDEDTMFQAIAPYVEDGSFIEMAGEDGDRWRWVFKDGKCKEVRAKVTWSDE